ncbi:hypothetical protein ACM66B_005504 [Microbotryomycetes sp. NB124-2]
MHVQAVAPRIGPALALAAGFRVALIAWGTVQDAHSPVKYTDIDYFVFTDAARCVITPNTPGCSLAHGPLATLFPSIAFGDPYARDTYRYTPLLALLMAPNVLAHDVWGKVLFASADLVVGLTLYHLVRSRAVKQSKATMIVGVCWLWNPVIANISTRGSAESVLGMLVVATLMLAEKRRWDAAAITFGLAVHFKIYPIIYGSSLLAALTSSKPSRTLMKPFTLAHLRFGFISFACFATLNAVAYLIWGWPFLEHTYLYHVHRLDHRHNFSPYFYAYYLGTEPSSPSSGRFGQLARHSLASFVPQMGLAVGSGFWYGTGDLAFAWFVQTAAFVTFNKVCTSQYFLWYLWLLPPAIPTIKMSARTAMSLAAIWVAGQAVWLSQAFRLEMKGEPVYGSVWLSSIAWFVSHGYVLVQIVRLHVQQRRGKAR